MLFDGLEVLQGILGIVVYVSLKKHRETHNKKKNRYQNILALNEVE